MKQYKLICLFFLLSVLLSSCRDYLNVQPSNILSINSYDDIKSLMGAHLKMYKDGSSGNVYLKGTSVFFYTNIDYLITHFYADDLNQDKYLDNFFGKNNRGDFYRSLDWQHTSVHEKIWTTYYGNIGFYNMVLGELAKFPGPDEQATNLIRAEAKFLRAWSFFRLMQFFSPYHQNQYGLPLNTDPEKVGTYDKSRKTQTENYTFIITELEEILNYNSQPSETYSIFFDKQLVHALLAQVYLYKGDSGAKDADDYNKALNHAQKVMDGQHRLSLETIARVPKPTDSYGLKKDNNYALLTFLYGNSYIYQNTVAYPFYGLFQYASDELYAMFPDADKRKAVYFGINKEILKFESEYPNYYSQWDFFTAPEMQLIIAESYARMNKEAEALNALKHFTNYRYSAYTRPTGTTVLQSVLDERRKEFCFDYCMRWIDLTRIQKGWRRKALDKKDGGNYTLNNNDFRFCMPIPKIAELQNNKIEQNPGWGNF